MNPAFFQQIEGILHTERIDVYRRDGADHQLTLARYMLNMALSESLYPSLQFAEIALRNAVHRELTARCGTDAWYDSPAARLTSWQQDKVAEAKATLQRNRKPPTAGRIVAELTFGFWTGFFNNAHARTGVGAFLSRKAFPHAPATELNSRFAFPAAGKSYTLRSQLRCPQWRQGKNETQIRANLKGLGYGI